MIPEIRKIRMYLAQLENDIESIIEQANAIKQENIKLKKELEEIKKRA